MIPDTAYMITAFVMLLVVIDPIAIAPLFLAMTPNMTSAQRERIARRAVLVAGPGAIASVILLIGRKPGGEGLEIVLTITAVVLLFMYIMLRLSSRLEQAMGKVAINVFTRIFDMLLAALSVQFVLDGLAEFGFVTPIG